MATTETTLSHGDVHITRLGRGPARPRFIGILEGLVGVARYCCFDNSIENAYTAVMERVFYHKVGESFVPPAVPSLEVVLNHMKAFVDEFSECVTTTVPVSLLVYPELNYRGRKLRIYQKARDNVLGRTWLPRFGELKTFIKHEKILMKCDKRLVPRVIQPRSPEYNVCVGRYIRQLEHRIYQMIDRLYGGPTVMKGLNCVQQGKAISDAWFATPRPVAVMLDAVRFDQHVSVPVLSWEHSIYKSFFPEVYQPELEWLLSKQLFNQGRILCPDGKIEYSTVGCRASGDMNTAMGNVLIMCAAVYGLLKKLGISARLINNGDDCCLIVDESVLDIVLSQLTPWFEELGFLIDIEGVVREPERICFCQTHPVFNGTRWVMVRDPTVALSKDATILRRWSNREFSAYVHELGIAGMAAYGDMPVWGEFYRCMSRSECGRISDGLRAHVRQPIDESGLGRLAVNVNNCGPVTDASRASFGLAFGIPPEVQRSIEEHYAQVQIGNAVVHGTPAVSLSI